MSVKKSLYLCFVRNDEVIAKVMSGSAPALADAMLIRGCRHKRKHSPLPVMSEQEKVEFDAMVDELERKIVSGERDVFYERP